MACCIVVGSCKEEALYLLPAALRDFVKLAYVVEVGTTLQNLDGQAKRLRFGRLACSSDLEVEVRKGIARHRRSQSGKCTTILMQPLPWRSAKETGKDRVVWVCTEEALGDFVNTGKKENSGQLEASIS